LAKILTNSQGWTRNCQSGLRHLQQQCSSNQLQTRYSNFVAVMG